MSAPRGTLPSTSVISLTPTRYGIMQIQIIRRALWLIGIAVLLSAGIGCTLDKQGPGQFFAPSEFGTSVTMTASPDQLPRDGVSRSNVTLTVRNDKGEPMANQAVTLSLVSGPNTVQVSQNPVVTNSSGVATFTITAPSQTTPGPNSITIGATPVGANFDNAATRTLTIALIGIANTTAPTASFTFTPGSPALGDSVTFDASASQDEGSACGTRCTYTWSF